MRDLKGRLRIVSGNCKESKSTEMEKSFDRTERDNHPQLAFYY
jgi:hypothetical protein